MRRYWINFKGEQSGPLSMEQLESMGVDKTAYVWHSGLDDWVKITKVPELNEMLERMAAAGSATTDASVDEAPELPVEDVPDLPPVYGAHGTAMDNVPQQMGYNPQYASGATHYSAAQTTDENPKCPPTNLVWAIISTICCCWPLGVVGIVFAYQTKKKFREGNYLKAEKFSEYGAWAIIASIVLGLMSTPLACSHYLLQGLG